MARPLLIVLAALLFSACTQDPAPTSPAEALFLVSPGAGNRQFEVIALTAGNASHTISQSLLAPYSFYLENAFGPVQGIFLPSTAASVEDVSLLFGGETVPRVVSNPAENSVGCVQPAECEGRCLCVNSGGAPDPMLPGSPEVRFDIVTTPPIQFSGDVGSINQDHLLNVVQSPATIYLEGAEESAAGVFTKFDINASLTATLLINGVAQATATSGPGDSGDAVVQFQFD